MKTRHKKIRFQLLAMIAVMLATSAVAHACPNCKEAIANDPAAQGLARGYYYSILFMLSMPILIISGLSSYFYWEICRARAQQPVGIELGTADEQ